MTFNKRNGVPGSKGHKWLAPLLIGSLLSLGLAPHAEAVSATSTRVELTVGAAEAIVNGSKSNLESPARLVNGELFVPARWLGEQLNFPVSWNDLSKRVTMVTSKAYIEFDPAGGQTYVNGKPYEFASTATLVSGRLLVRLSWLVDYVGFSYKYSEAEQQAELLYTGVPAIGYTESDIYKNDMPNSKPVAKFMFGKDTYRIGEPIDYIDLSYDPDSEGLPGVEWEGRQDAFFQPGDYTISLRVTDPKGNVSDTVSRKLHIAGSVFLTETEYPLYYKPAGTVIHPSVPSGTSLWANKPLLSWKTEADRTRSLIAYDGVSTTRGFLYQGNVNGKSRLYVNHRNETGRQAQFAVVVRNPSTDKPVTLRTTKQSEVFPTVFDTVIANRASVEFLRGEPVKDELTVQPGQTVLYKTMTDYDPGEAITAYYDIETSAEAIISYVLMSPGDSVYNLGSYAKSDGNWKVRGTYPVSRYNWELDGKINEISRLSIGDETADSFVKGTDSFDNRDSVNRGNYGVEYNIRIVRPRKAAIVLVPRGGYYQGAVKVDGTMMMVSSQGGLTSLDGGVLLKRTNGLEPWVDIQMTPPAGSKLPLDIVVYPLDDKE